MNYFWGPEDTSVHFCEDKYVHSYWIAEYFNTISSIFYILVGVYFFKYPYFKSWSKFNFSWHRCVCIAYDVTGLCANVR